MTAIPTPCGPIVFGAADRLGIPESNVRVCAEHGHVYRVENDHAVLIGGRDDD